MLHLQVRQKNDSILMNNELPYNFLQVTTPGRLKLNQQFWLTMTIYESETLTRWQNENIYSFLLKSLAE